MHLKRYNDKVEKKRNKKRKGIKKKENKKHLPTSGLCK